MIVAPSITKRCEDCQIVNRSGTLFVVCATDPRCKQRQPRPKKRKIKGGFKRIVKKSSRAQKSPAAPAAT